MCAHASRAREHISQHIYGDDQRELVRPASTPTRTRCDQHVFNYLASHVRASVRFVLRLVDGRPAGHTPPALIDRQPDTTARIACTACVCRLRCCTLQMQQHDTDGALFTNYVSHACTRSFARADLFCGRVACFAAAHIVRLLCSNTPLPLLRRPVCNGFERINIEHARTCAPDMRFELSAAALQRWQRHRRNSTPKTIGRKFWLRACVLEEIA